MSLNVRHGFGDAPFTLGIVRLRANLGRFDSGSMGRSDAAGQASDVSQTNSHPACDRTSAAHIGQCPKSARD